MPLYWLLPVSSYFHDALLLPVVGVSVTKLENLFPCCDEAIISSLVWSSHADFVFPLQNIIAEHEIRNISCAAQDPEDLCTFAYITKDLQTSHHYCHVFSTVDVVRMTFLSASNSLYDDDGDEFYHKPGESRTSGEC